MTGPYHASASSSDSRPRLSAWTGALLLALVTGALFAFDLGGYPLLDPDEARHAEVARELAAGQGLRRLFLPTLELEPYREKPAAYYWLVALAYGLGGATAGAARVPSALAAWLVVLGVYAWAVPRMGVRGALGAGFVLATSAGWFGLARYAVLDMTLSACVALGVLSGLAWLDRPAPRRAPLLPYIGAGLGVLVKGPVGAVLVALPLAAAAVLHRPRPGWRECGLLRGTIVVALIAAVLYGPMGVLDWSYLRAFVATNTSRFGANARHAAPAYYYLLALPPLCLPWALFAVPAIRRAVHDPRGRTLLVWAVAVPAVLTLARGKLATYALSALVPVALVIGSTLATPRTGDHRALAIAGWIVAALLGAIGIAGFVAMPRYPVSPGGRMTLATLALGWAAALSATIGRGRAARVPVLVLGAMLTLLPTGVRVVAPAVSTMHSFAAAAQLIRPYQPAPVITWRAQAPSLVFYLATPLIHSEDPAFVRDLFLGDGPVFLVTGRRHFAEIDQLLGDRAHVWHATARHRLYGSPPPPAR